MQPHPPVFGGREKEWTFMTQLLIRLFVKNYQQADDPAVRTNYG